MRILEWILVLVTAAATVLMLVFPKRRAMTVGTLTALVLAVLLHGLINSFRVQMIPTYIVTLVLFITLIIQVMKSYRGDRYVQSVRRPNRLSIIKMTLVSILLLTFSAGSIILTWLLPAFTMPEPTGTYAIGTFSQHLVDESREETKTPEAGDKRELMINVWYPVDQKAAKGGCHWSIILVNWEKRSVWCLASRLRCSVIWIPFQHMWCKELRCPPSKASIRFCYSRRVSAQPVFRA